MTDTLDYQGRWRHVRKMKVVTASRIVHVKGIGRSKKALWVVVLDCGHQTERYVWGDELEVAPKKLKCRICEG